MMKKTCFANPLQDVCLLWTVVQIFCLLNTIFSAVENQFLDSWRVIYGQIPRNCIADFTLTLLINVVLL